MSGPPAPRTSAAKAPSNLVAGLLFGLMALVWGSTWPLIKLGLAYYPPFFSIAVRFVIAGPFFLVVMKLRGERFPLGWRDQRFFLLLGALSFVISYGVVYWASQYVTGGLASVLFALMPLFSNVAGRFMIGEYFGRYRIAGLVVGLAGIVIINSSDLALLHPKAPLAAAVLLISPLVVGMSTVLAKQKTSTYSPMSMAAFPMVYGAIAHTITWALFERHIPLAWSWPGVGILAYLTAFGTIFTFWTYYWLLPHFEVGRLNLLAYLTPLVALTLGSTFFGEALTLPMVAGAAVVLLGVSIANRSPAARKPKTALEVRHG